MHRLLEGWSIGAVLPGQAEPQTWWPVPGPAPLAAQLQALGQWSLDDPPRDFDAETWVWRLHFDRPQGASAHAVLGLDGLATVCEVRLNDQVVLHSENMHLAHRLPLGAALRDTGNVLTLRCEALAPRLARRRPRPRWRVPMLREQQLRWWRTTLLGRTPGWSPPAVPVGPWREVWLAEPRELLPQALRLRARVDQGQGVLDVAVDAAGVPGGVGELRLEVARRGLRHAVTLAPPVPGGPWTGRLNVPDPALWWPHTHGEPALYETTLIVDGNRLACRPIGFRSVACVQHEGGFALHVNGVPVFARGACWTPLDPLRLHGTTEQYAAALAQVRAAGMNMLRVTGSMVYEAEAFFDACDAQGVMVWQDFMFANMDYPAEDPAFLASVHAEVMQQMARWQGRPCMAVLCGNSEVSQQAAMWGAPRACWEPVLFHQKLPAWCAQVLPDIPYWPSSAHGGSLPFAPDNGTCSYYGVGAYGRPAGDAVASGLRFATECLAYANVPELPARDRMPGGRGLRVHHAGWKARSPRDLGAGWDFDDVRDQAVARLFSVDPAALRASDPERHLLLGRVAVARTMATAFSQWRRHGSACGGALVWFLRDLWAGAGWGLLDDQGAPKSAWHALSAVLQPVTVLLTDEGLNGLHLHLPNETARPLRGRLGVRAWRGEQLMEQADRDCELPPHSVTRLAVQELFEHFVDASWSYRFGPPPFDVLVATLHGPGGQLLGQALHLCEGLRGAAMADPGLQARCERVDASTADVVVQTRIVALSVHFEVEGWQAATAYFDLAPGAVRRVRLHRLPRGSGVAAETNETAAPLGCVLAANALRPVTWQAASAST